MVSSPINQPEDLHLLKEKCRNLESQCATYIRSLEAANHNLASEITRRKKAEAAIQNAHDELEKLVAERTKEIRLLKDRLQAENVFLKQELAASHAYGTIIGDSHPIKTVISQIELVAPTDANVLIHGESGTGKELVAREIHKHSSRKEKPLIKVNCATIPKALNVPCPRLTKANLIDLQSYHWPCNVRELENAIERAMILARSNDLNFSLIRAGVQFSESLPAVSMPDGDLHGQVMTDAELKQFERQNTISALIHCQWKIYGKAVAAQLLAIKPTTLIERMKRMKRMHIHKPPK